MVEIIGFQKRTNTDGEDFNVLVLQGSIELIKSSETGNYYASARRARSPAPLMIGCANNSLERSFQERSKRCPVKRMNLRFLAPKRWSCLIMLTSTVLNHQQQKSMFSSQRKRCREPRTG